MEKEIWKDIKDYENSYQISNLGRVKSLNYRHTGKEKVLKPKTDKGNYLRVSLCKNGKQKTFKLHRLVAMAFIPNPHNYPQVNHKQEEDKTNNCIENLEWCSAKYNVNYGTRNERAAKKISEKLKGIKRSETTKKKISEAKKGQEPWNKGKANIYSEATKKKMSESHKGKKLPEETIKKIVAKTTNGKCSKTVLQLDRNTNEVLAEFPSINEVERKLGFYHSAISQCCNGKRKSAYGFKWKYV